MVNPFLGVFFHWLGGLASASFYIPYRGVRKWSWETYWLAGGFFSWIIAPWFFALILVPELCSLFGTVDRSTLVWACFWGSMWGLGGLTFGLTMRYLGIALGMAIALGYCTAFGTLMPPLFAGTFMTEIAGTVHGRWVLFGIFICLLGIGVSGLAGISKEREMPEEQKKEAIKEFNFVKGILVATFSGIMSSCFAYGLAAGQPLAEQAKDALLRHGQSDLWQNLPVLIVVLLGGFTTNFIWCVLLNVKNSSGREYINPCKAESDGTVSKVPLLSNYLFAALAGTTWYMQFFFYGMGETRMGEFKFSSWTLHMASIIIFSTLWGVYLHEWKGSSRKTKILVVFGLFLLVLSTLVVGYGNYIKAGH